MADDHLDKLLGSLESSFDAGIARAEEEAASDLALSLLQDSSLHDALRCGGTVEAHLEGRAPLEVTQVGPDYVSCAGHTSVVVPLTRTWLSISPVGSGPSFTDLPFLALLRRMVRGGGTVEVRSRRLTYRGRLVRACSDHVVVSRESAGTDGPSARQLHVPLDAIDELHVHEAAR